MPSPIQAGAGPTAAAQFDATTTGYGNYPPGKLGSRHVEVLDGPEHPRSVDSGKWAAVKRNVSAFMSRIADVVYFEPEVDARRYNRAQKNLCREFDNMLGYLSGEPANPAKAAGRMGRMMHHFHEMLKHKPDVALDAVLRARMQVNIGELSPEARERVDSNFRQLDMDGIEESMVRDEMRALEGPGDIVGKAVPESEVRRSVSRLMNPLRVIRELALIGPMETAQDAIGKMSDEDLGAQILHHYDPEVVARRDRNLQMPEGERIRAAGEYGRDITQLLTAEMIRRSMAKLDETLSCIIRNLRDEVPPREKHAREYSYLRRTAITIQEQMQSLGIPKAVAGNLGLLKQCVARLSPEDQKVLLSIVSGTDLDYLRHGGTGMMLQTALLSLDDLIGTVLAGRADALRNQLEYYCMEVGEGRISVSDLKALRDALRDLEGAGPLPEPVQVAREKMAAVLGHVRPEDMSPDDLTNGYLGDMIKVLEYFRTDKTQSTLHNALKLEMNGRIEQAMTPSREEFRAAMRYASAGDLTEMLRASVRMQMRTEGLNEILSSFGTDTAGKDALFELRRQVQKPLIDVMSKEELLELHCALSSPRLVCGLLGLSLALASTLVVDNLSQEENIAVRARISQYTEPLQMAGQLVRSRLKELGEVNPPQHPISNNPLRDAQPRQLAALQLALGIDIIGEQPDGTVRARQAPAR